MKYRLVKYNIIINQTNNENFSTSFEIKTIYEIQKYLDRWRLYAKFENEILAYDMFDALKDYDQSEKVLKEYDNKR